MNLISNDEKFAADAIEVLKYVIDPEIGLNIIDLGLVYQLDIDKEALKIYCTMTLTTRFCPMGDVIREGTQRALAMKFREYEIIITLVFDPPWSSNRISEEGRLFLNQ